MTAEDRAAQALARHYDHPAELIPGRFPRLHRIIAALIAEAEARGRQQSLADDAHRGLPADRQAAPDPLA
jgi:hypothetical protein